MLQTEDEKTKGIGVIVGRFQVANITNGHKQLIESVMSRHTKTICIIGLSEIRASKNNPMDFETRKRMLSDVYPELNIFYLKDCVSDNIWSLNLDNIIRTHSKPNSDVTLYGSRDCFIDYYSGKYKTKEFLQEVYTTGTEDRDLHGYNIHNSEDFRKGVIWATQNQYDSCFPTVDVAILDEKSKLVLLGRKPNEDKFRFIGGFVEPSDMAEIDYLEKTVRRETHEECGGIEIGDIQYVCSSIMDDWRYRSEKSKIVTTLFTAKHIFGRPKPADDICELKWFKLTDLKLDGFVENNIMEVHMNLLSELIEKLKIK